MQNWKNGLLSAAGAAGGGVFRGFEWDKGDTDPSTPLTNIGIESGDTPLWLCNARYDLNDYTGNPGAAPYVSTTGDPMTVHYKASCPGGGHATGVATLPYGSGDSYLDGTETSVYNSSGMDQFWDRNTNVMLVVFAGSWDIQEVNNNAFDYPNKYSSYLTYTSGTPSLSANAGDLIVSVNLALGPYNDTITSYTLPSGYEDPQGGTVYYDNQQYDKIITFGYKISEGGTESGAISYNKNPNGEVDFLIRFSPA
jgi:hypothetical protein